MGNMLILKTPPEIPEHDLLHAHNIYFTTYSTQIRILWFCHRSLLTKSHLLARCHCNCTINSNNNKNNSPTYIIGHMLWYDADTRVVLTANQTNPVVKWNHNIGDYLKGGDGVTLPCTTFFNGAKCVGGCPSDADYQVKAALGPAIGLRCAFYRF
jgi:hypothetical protein